MAFTLKIKIRTPEIDETVAFYAGIFAMTVAQQWDEPGDRGAILALPDGREEAFLEIYHDERAHDFSGLSLQFRTADLDGFVARLDPALPREGPRERPWGSRYLYLTDPNGILVIVFEGGL